MHVAATALNIKNVMYVQCEREEILTTPMARRNQQAAMKIKVSNKENTQEWKRGRKKDKQNLQ